MPRSQCANRMDNKRLRYLVLGKRENRNHTAQVGGLSLGIFISILYMCCITQKYHIVRYV